METGPLQIHSEERLGRPHLSYLVRRSSHSKSPVHLAQKAYVALNTLGLLPTIADLRLLGSAMQATATGAGATAAGMAGLVGAIAAAAAISLVLTRAVDGWLASIAKAHPLFVRFASSILGAINPLYALLRQLGFVGPETEKVADSQSRAVAPVRDLTEATDEEAESLKQLRRALAEVELATKSRVAAAQRAYGEERTTLAEFTRERIAALEEERAAKLKQIDEDLRLKRQEAEARGGGAEGLVPHGADDKDRKKLLDDIEQLELERKKVVQETTDAIADIQSEARKKERDNAERHRESILAVQRTEAEEKIDVLREAAERNEALRLQSERKIVEIERGITDAEIREVRRRIEAVAGGTEERVRLEDELSQKLAEKRKQRAEQERRLARARLEADLLPVKRAGLKEGAAAAGDEGTIARLRDAAERGAASVAETEQRIGNIIDAGFARRIQNTKDEIAVRTKHKQDVAELNAQLAQLEQERANASEDASRRVVEGVKEDAEARRESLNRLLPLERALAAARLATRKALLDATRFIFGREKEYITERYAIEREQIDLAHKEAIAELTDREHEELLHARRTLGKDEDFNKRRLEIQKLYDALRAEQAKQTQVQIDENERQKRRDLELQDPTSGRSLFGDDFQSALDEGLTQWQAFSVTLQGIFGELSAQAGNMRSIMFNAISGIGNALAQSITNWILYGGSIGKAMKQAAAAVVAGIAVQAGIKAIWEVAEGLAALANPFTAWQAPLHFAAAKMYGLVAAGALAVAVGLRAAIGTSGSTGAAGALADSSSGSGASTEREDARTRYMRERAEEEKYWKREDRRGESWSATVEAPFIVDGQELGRAFVRIVRDGGDDIRGGLGRALTGVVG